MLTPIPQRFTVEWRAPKIGERVLDASLASKVRVVIGSAGVPQWVVVDD
jgi:hypothetical protein